MGRVVLLTGATGFLGSHVARLLLRDTDREIIVLVRGKDSEDSRRRMERAWDDWPESAAAIGSRVRVVSADLSLPRLGTGRRPVRSPRR